MWREIGRGPAGTPFQAAPRGPAAVAGTQLRGLKVAQPPPLRNARGAHHQLLLQPGMTVARLHQHELGAAIGGGGGAGSGSPNTPRPGAQLRTACPVRADGQSDTFDDQRVKEIVSREAISGRYLYGEAFDFMPTHKLWVRGNHRPAVLDSGDGMWRRLILLPFDRQFAPDQRVRDLDRQLLEEEGSGILNWCIAGCLEWQKHGLGIPTTISRESAQYRDDTDVVGEWIATECEVRPGLRGSLMPLYESCRQFCGSAGIAPKSKPAFARLMSTTKGNRRGASNGKPYLSGIDLSFGDL